MKKTSQILFPLLDLCSHSGAIYLCQKEGV